MSNPSTLLGVEQPVGSKSWLLFCCFAQHLAAHIFGIELLNIDLRNLLNVGLFNMGARNVEQSKV
jgi:hypothetical protein